MPLSRPATGRLPDPRSSFVGRERERSELAAIATAHRLVTLVGPGGMGKTRLALRVARGLIGAYPDGVWFIELAPLSRGDPVDHTVLTSLGLQSQPGLAPRALLLDALASQRALLLVDNCEHVLDEIAPLV